MFVLYIPFLYYFTFHLSTLVNISISLFLGVLAFIPLTQLISTLLILSLTPCS